MFDLFNFLFIFEDFMKHHFRSFFLSKYEMEFHFYEELMLDFDMRGPEIPPELNCSQND